MINIDHHVMTQLGFAVKSNVEDKIWIGKQYIFSCSTVFEKNEFNTGVWSVNTEARKNISGKIFFLRISGHINFANTINAKKRTIRTNYTNISFFKIKNQIDKKFKIEPPAINDKILEQFPEIPGCTIYISIEKKGMEFELNIEEPESFNIEQIINFLKVTIELN
jgi:hypothetical protein